MKRGNIRFRNQRTIVPTRKIIAEYDDNVNIDFDLSYHTCFMIQANQGSPLRFTVDGFTPATGSRGFYLNIGDISGVESSGHPHRFFIGHTKVSIFQLSGSTLQGFNILKGN